MSPSPKFDIWAKVKSVKSLDLTALDNPKEVMNPFRATPSTGLLLWDYTNSKYEVPRHSNSGATLHGDGRAWGQAVRVKPPSAMHRLAGEQDVLGHGPLF